MKGVSKQKRIQAGRLIGLGESTTSVAEYVGVSRQALSLWKDDADFNKAIEESKVVFQKLKIFYVGEKFVK